MIFAKWGGQPCSDNAGVYGFWEQKYYTNLHSAYAIVRRQLQWRFMAVSSVRETGYDVRHED